MNMKKMIANAPIIALMGFSTTLGGCAVALYPEPVAVGVVRPVTSVYVQSTPVYTTPPIYYVRPSYFGPMPPMVYTSPCYPSHGSIDLRFNIGGGYHGHRRY